MTDENILIIVQAKLDGKMIGEQHKDYCGRFWFHTYADWDFKNYYYRVIEIGDTYKDTNNKTLVLGEEIE